MNLLHKEPLVFAKKILSFEKDKAEVICEFEQLPTIGMFVEAAAQSTAAFFQNENIKSGYLAQANNIEIVNEIKEKNYIVELIVQIQFESMVKYNFLMKNYNDKKIIAKGEVTISVQ